MHRIWEHLSTIDNSDNTITITASIDSVLSDEDYQYNSSFTQTWVDFNARNLFNGTFSTMDNEIYYYEDQALISPIIASSSQMSDSTRLEMLIDNSSVDIQSYSIGNDDIEGVYYGYMRPMDVTDLSSGIRLLRPEQFAAPLADWP